MKKTEFASALLKERYTHVLHDSGLNIYVFPKRMTGTYALFATAYGSIDNHFSLDNGEEQSVPDGIAHFLEHKLFDNAEGGDAFATFSSLGADANAYTSYNRTAYLFSCTEHFGESLEELLSFVTHPYFTEQTVKKEQGIISEEIRMYEDSPWERVYQNLLCALYRHHPVRKNICGTVRSIHKITPELLYRCHEVFYDLSNMALVVCGNVEVEDVIAVADRALAGMKGRGSLPIRHYPTESSVVAKTRTVAYMPISKPIFNIGIKDDVLIDDPNARLQRDISMSLLNEILFSQSGELYSALFEEGLITPSFTYGYSSTESFAFNCISGESDQPDAVLGRIRTYLREMVEKGIDDGDFERCRRALYADEIRAYDSTEEIANRLLAFVFDGADMFSVPHLYERIQKKDLEMLLRDFYREERFALSIIFPENANKE